MKLVFTGMFTMTPRDLIRRANYGEAIDPKTREVSYMKRMTGALYPRFHAYIERTVNGFTVNLHLDQKQPSYGAFTAHNGEYDGDTVEEEGARVKEIIEGLRLK